MPAIKQPTKRQVLLLSMVVVGVGNKKAEALSRRQSKIAYSFPNLHTMTQCFLNFTWPEYDLKLKDSFLCLT